MNERARIRVVVTGIGVVSPIGIGAECFWASVADGFANVAIIHSFSGTGLRNRYACPVNDEALVRYARDLPHDVHRATLLGYAAGRECLLTAGADGDDIDAVYVGTTSGHFEEERPQDCARGSLHKVPAPLRSNANFAATIAHQLRIGSPAYTVGTACSAGNVAITCGADLIRRGSARRVLCGGADALSYLAFVGFARLRAMAGQRCQPFTLGRDGMLLGEGAAFLHLESYESAVSRGARIHAEIAGYGRTCDAGHITTPDEDGRGMAAAMKRALRDAGLGPADIDYVCAHGTGTPANDLSEARACRAVFGEHDPLVSSLKALTGHTLGASSAIEAVACILSLGRQSVIPHWVTADQDPECAIRLAGPRSGPGITLDVVANNAFAFGGNNSCVLIRRTP
ncbi:MAG: beta-ketoacyl-[acyl-carrier-protein] synthase family protein [Bacteroidetes bacterium]|nr:beta-ketoacyl-[acyl-carrier-protein] synthase family protein [Bacteroidota bacterium]